MKALSQPEVWFICGSQYLYGPASLQEVASNAQKVAEALDASKHIPLKVRYKVLLTSSTEVLRLIQEANSSADCSGAYLWMHTFSPVKMWIRGLAELNKPFVICTPSLTVICLGMTSTWIL
ncbi:MAG: hypothetical protein R2880_20170 [Deinococcales bacterium]